MRRLPLLALGLVLALGFTACDDTDLPTAPSSVSSVPVSLTATLARAITDEYRAETTYEGVVVDFGQVLPFVTIISAEQRHSAAIARLYTSRDLAVPPNPWTIATVPHFSTLREACAAGAAAERANIAMYDELLRTDLPADVRQVFTNNRSASLENHLPAFERCM